MMHLLIAYALGHFSGRFRARTEDVLRSTTDDPGNGSIPQQLRYTVNTATMKSANPLRWSSGIEEKATCPFDGDCGHSCLGTDYGGRQVPLPVEEILERSRHKVMYSFGVGADISFDVVLACKFQLHVKLFDPSPDANKHFEHVASVVGAGDAHHTEDDLYPVAGKGRDPKTYWDKVRMTPIKSAALEMHQLGVANEDGNLTFYHSKEQMDAGGGSWSLDPGMRGSGGDTITVPVQTLEHILGDDTPPALKIDVEGLELDLLSQLLKMGDRSPPVIFVDFDSICCCMGTQDYCARQAAKGHDMIKRMETAGYRYFQHGEGDYTFLRKTYDSDGRLPDGKAP